MMRPVVVILLACLAAAWQPVLAQQPEQPKERARPDRLQIPPNLRQPNLAPNAESMLDLRRRLIELDRLLSLGSISRAESLLQDLAQHRGLQRELTTRRIKLAQLKGDHAEAIRLTRAVLVEQPRNPGMWRSLAVSQLADGQPDSARYAIGRFITTNPNGRSATMVGVDLLQQAGEARMAVSLIDTMRLVLGEPRLLGRQRAVNLLGTGQSDEAAAEIVSELKSNPFNLALIRTELLESPYLADDRDFLERLTAMSRQSDAGVGSSLLAANLLVARAEVDAALSLLDRFFVRPDARLAILQNSVLMVRELELLALTDQMQPTVDYLLFVLERLTGPENQDRVLRMRAADQLAQVCSVALTAGALGGDPGEAVARFADLLGKVKEVNPGSEVLYSSQIKLAAYTRDALGQPEVAARSLERLLLNLNLPSSGVALVRLTLGECYLAAGDTARGRVVLDNLGRDPDYRQAAGHAHYHLARLDLAQNHFATARDRFAVVALDNPGAPYANEALDMGLAIAEEMDNPTGGPDILSLYAPSVYYDLTANRTARRTALEIFLTEAEPRLDPEEPQHLLERARYELANLYLEENRWDEGFALLNAVVLKHPDGRYPARALALRGEILLNQGRGDEARRAWEQLLAQFPDYLFIDDVRDDLRAMP